MNAPIPNGHDTPWGYAEMRLVTCGRVISTANDKVAAFHDLAAGLGRDVREGFLNHVDVADRLTQLADAYGLTIELGADVVQGVIVEGLEKLNPLLGEEWSRTRRGLPLTFFDELSDNLPTKLWLIKNVMAQDETSSWIAPPGRGKSALLTDIAVHIAASEHWRGYRIKHRCGVVYFALERGVLVRRRFIAHKRRDELGSLPIVVVSGVIDLLHRSCVDTIIATISEAEQRFGYEVGLAIFDTYAKGIAAGGGDEDKAKDQNIVQANLRRVLDRGLHLHIAGVGHTGKDESKGERGSNARLADVDLQEQISGDLIKTATIKKANDQPEGTLTSFKLEPFDFGVDEDGEPFRTFIVSAELFSGEGQRSRKKTDRQELALRALAEVALSGGREPPADYHLPKGVQVVDAEAWRQELFRCNALDREAANPRARFSELRNGLAARNFIGSRDKYVWLVR
jgi:hypothetical protein